MLFALEFSQCCKNASEFFASMIVRVDSVEERLKLVSIKKRGISTIEAVRVRILSVLQGPSESSALMVVQIDTVEKKLKLASVRNRGTSTIKVLRVRVLLDIVRSEQILCVKGLYEFTRSRRDCALTFCKETWCLYDKSSSG